MNDDLRLCHSKKIFSKKNIVYINDILENGLERFVGPVITLDLTRLCNYNCPHCIDQGIVKNGDRSALNEIDYLGITTLLKELRARGARNIELTGGGEPMLYTKFEDFCIYVDSIGYKLALVTNGSYLCHYTELFRKVNFSWVRVSLDAGTPQTYSKLHGVSKELFLKVISNIKRISCYTNIGISYVICAENVDEVEVAYKLAVDLNAKYFEIKMMRNSKDNRIVEDSYSFMKKIASRKNYESKETKIIYPTEFSILKADNKQRCWASDLRAVITPGGMYRCTYARGKYSMPLPETAEEFIKNRNILNEEFVCNDACFFCTRFKLNVVVDELIGNPGYLKSMVDSCIDEEIEDEEWI